MRRWILAAALVLMACLLATAWPGQDGPDGETPPLRSAAEAGLVLQENSEGVWVMAVKEHSAASQADIRPGDYLEAAQGATLTDLSSLEMLWPAPSEGLHMTLRRDGVRIRTVLRNVP